MRNHVILLDQTLREGEQQTGIRFSAEQKVHILHHLEDFGFSLVEIGHPGISAEDETICRAVAQAARSAEILMHARANLDEIRAAARAGAHWVGIWASINDIALATKFIGHDCSEVEARIAAAVTEAKSLGLKVRFTVEDASRTAWPAVATAAKAALRAGADRISLADTTGTWAPGPCRETVARAIAELGCEIEVHLHNDLGLAHANALAAIEAGASVIDTSVLGIGERAGIVDSLELTVSLNRLHGDDRFRLDRIPVLARAVRTATGHRPDALRPVTGRNAFTHTSAYHVRAVQRNPEAYEAFPPELVGRSRTIHLDRPSTDSAVGTPGLVVGAPFVKGASELLYHRDGPGVRWVLMDARVDRRASLYVIQRFFGLHGAAIVPENHVDSHAHHCDSVFIFWGDQPDGGGLTVEVEQDDETALVHSPASVFIPAETRHSYRYVSGRGTYTNIVLAPEYNASLMQPAETVTAHAG